MVDSCLSFSMEKEGRFTVQKLPGSENSMTSREGIVPLAGAWAQGHLIPAPPDNATSWSTFNFFF